MWRREIGSPKLDVPRHWIHPTYQGHLKIIFAICYDDYVVDDDDVEDGDDDGCPTANHIPQKQECFNVALLIIFVIQFRKSEDEQLSGKQNYDGHQFVLKRTILLKFLTVKELEIKEIDGA